MPLLILLMFGLFILWTIHNDELAESERKTQFIARLEALVAKDQREKADLLARVEALEKIVKP